MIFRANLISLIENIQIFKNCESQNVILSQTGKFEKTTTNLIAFDKLSSQKDFGQNRNAFTTANYL